MFFGGGREGVRCLLFNQGSTIFFFHTKKRQLIPVTVVNEVIS